MSGNPYPPEHAQALREASLIQDEDERRRAINRITDRLARLGLARDRSDDDGWTPRTIPPPRRRRKPAP